MDLKSFKNLCMIEFGRKRALEKSGNISSLRKASQETATHYEWKMKNTPIGMLKKTRFWSDSETEDLITVLKEGFRTSIIFKKTDQSIGL